ncbi:SDR family NAD(P)-dependent oxidoreductase [Bacillus spizizenii]|nr:SDR family NAD(P)-dependent oxidoreductase [Bacillus spizizenii]
MKTDFISLSDLKASFINEVSNNKKQKKDSDAEVSENDVAIIGVSCKIGEANHVDEYWELLLRGKEFIKDIPKKRKQDADHFFKHTGSFKEDTAYTKIAYMDEIDKFDYNFFGILPNEAKLIDPRQRLFLETAWSAIEDAGYGGEKLYGSNTGIYIGLSSDGSNEYFKLLEKGDRSLLGLATAGNIKSVIASRLSYILDLRGPAMVIDTACSSSLVALHTACKALKNNDCDTALVGGVNIKIFPKTVEESKWNIGNSSSDFSIKTFDDRADGTNSGEGVAAVLLKPLAKAIRDNDQIYAVIKGSAVNQDGSSVGITAPNAAAQEKVILDAWKNAQIDPKTITYIEAHGTGTKLGDPIEINAIQRAFSRFTNRKQFCAISSVKTNIGHLDSLAGLAGVIKAVMALKHKKIPPNLHFRIPNRNISFHESPVYVNDTATEWKSRNVYRCGVSSFGLSGTNCHVILEEPPKREKNTRTNLSLNIFTLSAKTKTALFNLMANYIDYLEEKGTCLDDICYTANTGRLANKYRIAVIVSTKAELIQKLKFLFQSEWKTYRDQYIYFGELTNRTKFIGNSQIDKIHENQEIEVAIQRIKQDYSSIARSDLQLLSKMYCNGESINFEEFYRQLPVQKINLPTYVFSGKRLWAELKEERFTTHNNENPLLSNLVLQSLNLDVYVAHLNADDCWFLNEHRVNDSFVIPGTVYVETARAVGRKYFGESCSIHLKNMMFSNLLKVKESEIKEVQTIIKSKNNSLEFSVISRSEAGWIKHAEALITKGDRQNKQKYDIETLKKDCDAVYVIQKNNESLIEIDENDYAAVIYIEDTNRPESIVDVGGRWKCTNAIYRKDDELLCELQIPKEYEKDFNDYSLHPAMMDCAVNAATFTIDEETYLPYYYKDFQVYSSGYKKFFSYIKKKESDNGETGKFDIFLLNEKGEVFGEINNYIVKKVHKSPSIQKKKNKPIYHKMSWVSIKNDSGEISESNKNILLFRNKDNLSDEIVRRLRLNGKSVIEAEYGESFSEINSNKYTVGATQEDYDQLFETIQKEKINQIVHLMSIDNEPDETLSQLQKKLCYGIDSLFYLTKSIVQKTKHSIELVLCSDYAYRVTGDEPEINPHNAAFFGFGKVIEKEYPRLSVRCIDLEHEQMAENALREINSIKQTEFIAYRNNQKYVQELQNVNIAVSPYMKTSVKNNGVYIITGGMGGIGLQVAKYLSSTENVQLILIGRSEQSEKNRENIREVLNEIKENGSQIEYYKADVANEDEMFEVFREIKRKYKTVNGIIHAAGVSGDGFIFRKQKSVFDTVIKPKIQGTWILNDLTKDCQLDFFVMFSSITALGGSIGQSDYTAANSYLDSFAEFRKWNKPEEKTLTINWCGWSDLGMLADYIVKRKNDGYEHKEENGFKTITSTEAIRAFNEVLQKDMHNVIIGEIDYQVLGLYKDEIKFRLSPDILDLINPPSTINTVRSEVNQANLNNLNYREIENRILKAWTKVLGLEQINVNDKFYDLGGDSISAIYLVKEIENEFPSLIDVSDIFTYPSIQEMSAYLDEVINNQQSSNQISDNEQEDDLDMILNKLASGDIEVSEANKLLQSDGK